MLVQATGLLIQVHCLSIAQIALSSMPITAQSHEPSRGHPTHEMPRNKQSGSLRHVSESPSRTPRLVNWRVACTLEPSSRLMKMDDNPEHQNEISPGQ